MCQYQHLQDWIQNLHNTINILIFRTRPGKTEHLMVRSCIDVTAPTYIRGIIQKHNYNYNFNVYRKVIACQTVYI